MNPCFQHTLVFPASLLLAATTGHWILQGARPSAQERTPSSVRRLWNAKDLADWAIPVAGINQTPRFYSEKEYYAAPVENLRTYAVYHPRYEPKGYMDWLRKQGPQPLVEPDKLKTEEDWIEAGRRVFDELDVPLVRTGDPRALEYLRDAKAIESDGTPMSKDGRLAFFRWVVERDGEIKLGLSECSSCRLRFMPDGSVLRGAPATIKGGGAALGALLEEFRLFFGRDGNPASCAELNYPQFAVPWLPNDIHLRLKTLSEADCEAVVNSDIGETVARFNGSPYYTTKIMDLNGVKDRRYLNHTATHLNRGPEDIARYAILVAFADDGAIGPHRFLTDAQRRLRYRFGEEAMLALGKFIYTLEPPPNPDPPAVYVSRGMEVFQNAGCGTCHMPPLYTNNMLIPVDGFEPPPNHPATARLNIMNGVRVGTDPGLALKTRKGTGYYRVASLRGLWYRPVPEHSGSIATLEEWFSPKRLSTDYVPGGWKGPGVLQCPVTGHEFGLNLSGDDKRALIAFLRTL